MSTSLPATGVGAGVAAFARTESNEGATILGANVLELTGVATKEVGTEVVKEEGEVRGIEEGREEEFVFFVDGVEVVGGLEVLDSGIDARSETADCRRDSESEASKKRVGWGEVVRRGVSRRKDCTQSTQ